MQKQSRVFLSWLHQWTEGLPSLRLEEIADPPARVALVSEDLVKGFCDLGPLASERSASVVPAVVDLFERAYDLGVRHFLLLQDTHEPDAVEFSAYPAHCVAGSEESETIDELKDLPFSDLFTIFPKDSISSSLGTELEAWLEDHSEVTAFIVVGVCTDICVYQSALYLRVRANVQGRREVRVVVPANCVETYDMPVDAAKEIGALPHDGDLLHRVFLYSLALNGVEVVRSLG
ncbi:MAG: isochorismatase family protein [Anaerolineae bacterium]